MSQTAVLTIDQDAIRRVPVPEFCQVIHVRKFDPFQPGKADSHGGATVALRVVKSPKGSRFIQVIAGVALCHEDDRFVKAYGRGIAILRLSAAPVIVDLELPISSMHITPEGSLMLPQGRFLIEAVAKECIEEFQAAIMVMDEEDLELPTVEPLKDQVASAVNDRLDAYDQGLLNEEELFEGLPEGTSEQLDQEVRELEAWDATVNSTFAPPDTKIP